MFGLAQGTANEIWPQWVGISLNTSAATMVNTQIWNTWSLNAGTQVTGGLQVWQAWTTGTAGVTIQVTSNQVWNAWNPFVNVQPIAGAPAFIHRETEQERQARVAYELREAERQKQTEADRKLAAERARKLLLENLSEEQRRELAEKKHFHLRTRSGRLFRLNVGQGRSHNVKEIAGERIVKSFCAYPTGDIPEDDAILGQKLALEHDEGEFLRLAYSRVEAA